MMDVASRWGHVDVGALVADGNGHYWRVLEKRIKLPAIAYLITDGQKSLWVQHGYDDDVTLISEETGRAAVIVQGVMPDAKVVVEALPKGPDAAWLRARYHAHLSTMHGYLVTETKSNTLQSLIELHAMLTASTEPARIPHIHEGSAK